MADTHYPHLAGGTQPYNQHYNQHYNHQHQSNVHPYVKAATAATAGGSLLVLSGLTLAGTVIALTVATPLLVIFSPILVPAVLTVFFLATGFLTSGGLGAAAATVLSWMYKYVTGGNPPGADSLDQATYKLGSKVRDVRDRAEHAGRETWDRAEHAGRGAEHAAGVGHQRTG